MSYGFDLLTNSPLASTPENFQFSPLSRIDNPSSSYSHLNVPFSLIFTSFRPGTETPLLFTVLCPDSAFYTVTSADDFEEVKSNFVMHRHNTFELIYIIEGEFYQRIEQTRHKYTAGSCCLLNPHVFHVEDYSCDCRFATLSLSPDFLDALFLQKHARYFKVEQQSVPGDLQKFITRNLSLEALNGKNYIDFIPCESSIQTSETIHYIFDSLTHQIISPYPGSSLIVQALVYQIFQLLGSPECFHTTPIRLGTVAETALFSAISKRMEETHGRITRKELAQEFRYSGTYLNAVVKKFTGLSIFQYGNTFTMQEAARLLTDTTLSVSEIATELSFTDRTHFYRLFRQTYGMTPKEYREQHIKAPAD